MDFKFIVVDNVCVIRQQFPICLSYAITAHSSQGLSLKNACIDAGNNMFSCGQTYVAFSRITELRGLHLINFDPSKIKASEEAILEYNRLRSLYRPDLLPFDVPKNTSLKNQVADCKWALSKNLLIAQNNCINLAAIEWNVHGLINENCDYINATLQSLFNNENLRRVFLESKENSILKRLYELYKSKKLSPNDVNELKKFVDKKYSFITIQHDVGNFLRDLFNNFPVIQQIYGHEICTVLRCVGCDERITTDFENRYIISLALPKQKVPSTLQQICDYNFEIWPEVDNYCSNGCKSRLLRNYELRLIGSSLILQLEIFANTENDFKIQNLKINQVPTSKVNIRNKQFNVSSAIFLQGNQIITGCYHNMLRCGKQWIKVCNTYVQKSSWPKLSKDIYIIFLEQCNK